MININDYCLNENVLKQIKIVKMTDQNIDSASNCYKDIFNGAPFYENWTTESAKKVLKDYTNDNANILLASDYEKIIGFLISIDGYPKSESAFIPYDMEEVRYIEDIGIDSRYRGKKIASELTRIDLIDMLKTARNYIVYRTNMMRNFIPKNGENFITALERVQKEDKLAIKNGEKIIIPDFSIEEKNDFVNKYIEIIKKYPELDVSHSNKLFRNFFGTLDFCECNGQYLWKKDPTGIMNDRIYPVIKIKSLRKN